MTLLGQDVLSRAGRKNAPLRQWLLRWVATVENAVWLSLEDVRSVYPNADGVKLKSNVVVTIFNVKGNNYRLLTSIDYDAQITEALEVISHSEYDKSLWKDRY
jgi:mRNA interferase HigB